eukprot:1465930-Rhodomonas_salina.1
MPQNPFTPPAALISSLARGCRVYSAERSVPGSPAPPRPSSSPTNAATTDSPIPSSADAAPFRSTCLPSCPGCCSATLAGPAPVPPARESLKSLMKRSRVPCKLQNSFSPPAAFTSAYASGCSLKSSGSFCAAISPPILATSRTSSSTTVLPSPSIAPDSPPR